MLSLGSGLAFSFAFALGAGLALGFGGLGFCGREGAKVEVVAMFGVGKDKVVGLGGRDAAAGTLGRPALALPLPFLGTGMTFST